MIVITILLYISLIIVNEAMPKTAEDQSGVFENI